MLGGGVTGQTQYGQISLSVRPVKVGQASSSIWESTSTRSGALQRMDHGFSGMANVTAWESDFGKVGAHIQAFIGFKVERDIAAMLFAIGCATSP